MAKLIRVNGEIIEVKPKFGKRAFDLKELQTHVGGYVEIVFLPNDKIMVIDEEGKIKDKERNQKATTMLREKQSGIVLDYIAGDALICNDEEMEME